MGDFNIHEMEVVLIVVLIIAAVSSSTNITSCGSSISVSLVSSSSRNPGAFCSQVMSLSGEKKFCWERMNICNRWVNGGKSNNLLAASSNIRFFYVLRKKELKKTCKWCCRHYRHYSRISLFNLLEESSNKMFNY